MNAWFEAWTGYALQAPGWLLLLPLFAAVALSGRRRPAIRFAPAGFLRVDEDGRQRPLPRSLRQRLAVLPPLLQALGITALVVAMARPAERVPLPLEREGVDILLCLDVSSSMNADDLRPGSTRLAVTRDAAVAFVARRTEDRIGLITFARYPDLVCPPTLDHVALTELLRAVEPVEADGDEDATGIGMAVARAAQALRSSASASRVVILWTDGEENVARADTPDEIAPYEAARLCEELGVRVYTVAAGIGRQALGGGFVELDTGPVRELASITGGAFFEAKDADAVQRVYDVIGALETSRFAEPRFALEDRVVGALLAGIALWLAGRALAASWFGGLP